MVLHRVPRDTGMGFMKCWALRNCRVFMQKKLHLQCPPSSPQSYDPALTSMQEKRDVSVLISMCYGRKIRRWLYLTRRPKVKAQNLETIHLQKTQVPNQPQMLSWKVLPMGKLSPLGKSLTGCFCWSGKLFNLRLLNRMLCLWVLSVTDSWKACNGL